MKHRIQLALRSTGVEVKRWRGPVAQTTEILALRRVDLVLDVGANLGQFAEGLRLGGYRGFIESFEPARGAQKTLVAAAARDKLWRINPTAVGNYSGVTTLNETHASDLSSILTPTSRLVDRFSTANVKESYEIPITTLDAWWEIKSPGMQASSILLKSDTQGYDLRVLEGASALLPKVQVLQLEMSVQANYEDLDNTFLQVLDRVTHLGFVPARFDLVSVDSTGAAEEFDGIFVRPT